RRRRWTRSWKASAKAACPPPRAEDDAGRIDPCHRAGRPQPVFTPENVMSEVSSQVTAEHFRYIAEHTSREDSFLADLKRAASAEGIPSIWIAPEQASFMQILLKLAKAREVVEVGTLAGYSAIAMARALPKGGRVRTIEIVPKHADFAKRW